MTILKVGDRVRVLPGQGFDNLHEGSEHTVTYTNDGIETVRVSGTGDTSNWNMCRFEVIRTAADIEYVTALEAFKAKAIMEHPDLDDDPDAAEAMKLYDDWLADDSANSSMVHFKKAIKAGRRLQSEGK
jgi:hypothetical protein